MAKTTKNDANIKLQFCKSFKSLCSCLVSNIIFFEFVLAGLLAN